MFCAVQVLDREGGARSVVFNIHLTFTRGKVRSLRPFWLTAGYLSPHQFTLRGSGKLLLNVVVYYGFQTP